MFKLRKINSLSLHKLILIGIILINAGLLVSCNNNVKDAFEMNKKLGKGVNILGYDGAFWKNRESGRFQKKLFSVIKDGGFETVRVNLHPYSFMDSTYALKDSWLENLDWIVENALAADLNVILDLHEYNAMADDPIGKKELFLSVWRQLAPRYKSAPENVLFELLNEPNRLLTIDLWNQYLVEALSIVRETNPNRFVIIGPGNWNGYESLPTLKLPENDNKIIATFHFYHPMEFTHQGAPWSSETKDITGIKWEGSVLDQKLIEDNRFKSTIYFVCSKNSRKIWFQLGVLAVR
jgi:endoglucanase